MRRIAPGRGLSAVIAGAWLLSACHGSGGLGPTAGLPGGTPAREASIEPLGGAHGKIQHVIIVVQENRSFNNLFYGYPGAKTAKFGYDSKGNKIMLQPVTLATTWDLQHNGVAFINSCHGTGKIPGTDCKMDGFDNQRWSCGQPGAAKCPNKNPPYSYVPHDEIKPYFDMANQYVLADEMFASDFDTSSFESHQYIIAGVNPKNSVEYPSLSWGCPGVEGNAIDILGKDRKFPVGTEYPCWNPKTLASELDAAGITWAYYASPVKTQGSGMHKDCGGGGPDVSKGNSGIWSAYQAIKSICYGPDWENDVFSPSAKFLTDVSSGNLRSVTWVTPTYANSDHGGSGSKTGPSWVASIVNAVGESKYWKSSAIFIFWDDSGGWFDPVAPEYVDNDGLGFRLPLLIISPYAKQGLVSHVHYEHGSILKFVEDQFGLARLAASDTRAKSPGPYCFDFKQKPRKFTPIAAPYDQRYFESEPLDLRPPDTD
jgi:phospholipase C